MFTAKQRAEYLDCGGTVCPCCGSNKITSGGMDQVDYKEFIVRVTCEACGEEWHDSLILSDVEHIECGV